MRIDARNNDLANGFMSLLKERAFMGRLTRLLRGFPSSELYNNKSGLDMKDRLSPVSLGPLNHLDLDTRHRSPLSILSSSSFGLVGAAPRWLLLHRTR